VRLVSILSVAFATVVCLDMLRVDAQHGYLQVELLNETLLSQAPGAQGQARGLAAGLKRGEVPFAPRVPQTDGPGLAISGETGRRAAQYRGYAAQLIATLGQNCSDHPGLLLWVDEWRGVGSLSIDAFRRVENLGTCRALNRGIGYGGGATLLQLCFFIAESQARQTSLDVASGQIQKRSRRQKPHGRRKKQWTRRPTNLTSSSPERALLD
jgi:hypothetical protein